MSRYFILRNLQTLEVISAQFSEQPLNSLPYEVNDFLKPRFDKFPNPTQIIEGASEQEIEDSKKPIVPFEVPLWRIRAILKLIGKEENIASALESLEEPLKTGAKYVWEYGTLIERNSQTVLFLQSVLGMSNSEVDDIFIQAINIQI